ncbi:hypothetical protein Q4577_18960 [Marinovum sp. 2_MG-2023]|uniref:hypothetical protein n=1 Tax=unclassified Marinovum TaxID=2647166 RepID=UPI0026E16F47|nr:MULTISPECIES: hypothetical protein [unclassified Marinovum]MDO6732119.1 hypothetical protein [Marinovum sp. 2_MG-2023]MDO6781434.1 hypothetical protein [Marinovum sp. 1_MG-2023]
MSKQTNPPKSSASQQSGLEIQVVVSGSERGFEALKKLFEQAEPPLTGVRAASIPAGLEASTDLPVVVIGKAPALALAEMLTEGVLPSEAARRSNDALTQLLGTVRKARSRILLLDEASLLRAPAALVERLEQRLNIRVSEDHALTGAKTGAKPEPHADLALCQIVAQHILKDDTDLRSVSDQIDAMTIAADDVSSIDLADLDQNFQARLKQGEEHRDLSKEKGFLSQNIAEMQETISTLEAAAEKALKEREKAHARIDAAEAEAARLKADLAESEMMSAECVQLHENIAQLRDQVEQDALESDLQCKRLVTAEKQAVMAARQSQDREATLGAVVLRMGQARDAQVSANSQLRENNKKLHLRTKSLEDECAEQAEKLKTTQARHIEQAARISADKEALDQLQKALDDTRSELDHIYRSKSWKAATAIRNVRHGFKK